MPSRLKCRSKYITSFKFHVRGKRAKVYCSYNNLRRPRHWEKVPLTKKYRGHLYMLDAFFLPYKLRWTDASSFPLPSWFIREKAQYCFRRVVESIVFVTDDELRFRPFESVRFLQQSSDDISLDCGHQNSNGR